MNGRPGYRCRHGHTSAHPASEDAPRWVYWAEARLVEDLTATHEALAELDDADDLAAYLTTRDMVVVCGRGTLTIEDTAGIQVDAPVAAADHGAAQTAAAVAGARGAGDQRGRDPDTGRAAAAPAPRDAQEPNGQAAPRSRKPHQISQET
nr:hypothetical protein GCM10020092_081370 [Actinoplanes digitatis]